MKAREESIFNMFRATHQVRVDNDIFVLTIPMLDSTFVELKNRIANITGLVSLQAAVINGIAIDKEDLKEKMARLTYNYAGPGRAWAASNDDDTTYQSLNLVPSKIKKLADDVAGPACQNLYNTLNANALTLVPFGLTAAMLLELNTVITDYIAIVPLPTNAINIRQTYTDNISDKIKDTSLFLERQLDNIVRGQINTNADFVSTYFNGREIIDPPTNSTTFKIEVYESGSSGATRGHAVINARIEVVGVIDKVTYTDNDGKAELKQFKKDTYTLLVTADGYQPSQQIVQIGLGETKELTFLLTKLP